MRAALALAFHGQLSSNAIAQLIDGLPAAAQPDAVAAMALAGSASMSTINAVIGDDRLARWVFEFASAARHDPSVLL
jgi:hypothetical protein